jgi:MFS family permease
VSLEVTSRVAPKVSVQRVAAAALVGSLVEWYDFFLSASAAALVWPFVFFPQGNVALAVAMSIATYAITFLSRPLGSIVFGHYGDTRGRSGTLMWTLAIMGLSVLAVAILPSYSSIGIAAPVLLIVLRLVFGFGLGGEFGGAVSWVSEFASKSKWRAFWASLVQLPVPMGVGLSTLAFAFILSNLSRDAFLNWGWRVLFGTGAIVLVVGLVIRYALADSPMFEEIKKRRETLRLPAFQVLREQPVKIILLALIYASQVTMTVTLITPVGLSYFVAKGISGTYLTLVVGSTQIVFILFGIAGPIFTELIGRRKMMVISYGMLALITYPFFLLTASPDYTSVLLANILMNCNFGSTIVSAWMAEQFDTKYRYSGSGLSYQIGGCIAGIIGSVVVTGMLGLFNGIVNAWPYLIGLVAGLFVIAVIATLLLPETKRVPLT